MKKYFIVLILFLNISKSFSQTSKIIKNENVSIKSLEQFKGDTLSFIQTNFINNKQRYINRPLSYLLKDINIPVKKYNIGSLPYDKFVTPDLSLMFYDGDIIERMIKQRKNPIIVVITWVNPLSVAKADSLIMSNHLIWTKEVNDYYSQGIIRNIQLVNYGF